MQENVFVLSDKFSVICDQYNYLLRKHTGRIRTEKGKEREVTIPMGYYATLEQCLNAYVEICIKDKVEVSDTIRELIMLLQEVKQQFQDPIFKQSAYDYIIAQKEGRKLDEN